MECIRMHKTPSFNSSPQKFATPAPAFLQCTAQASLANPTTTHSSATRTSAPLTITSCKVSTFESPIALQQMSSNGHKGDKLVVSRRNLVGLLTWVLPYLAPFPAPAAPDESGNGFNFYTDEEQGYGLYIPEGWVKGEGQVTGQRKLTAFFPPNDTNTNVNIVITNVGADFTSLGSFGPIDSFAETLVNGLDRSWQKPPGQSAKLLNARSRTGLYYVEYTIQKPGDRMRHLLSAVGIGGKGSYNQLFTITGQFWEEEQDKYKEMLDKVVSSFKVL